MFIVFKIPVLALRTHTSERLQPVEESVFGPYKHFSNAHIDIFSIEARDGSVSQSSFAGLQEWTGRYDGFDKSVTSKNIR